jgi:glutathione S-transferase
MLRDGRKRVARDRHHYCKVSDGIRGEIERMRTQVHRQRGEIKQLLRAGIPTASAEALLDRMLDKIDALCAERDRLKKAHPWCPGAKPSAAGAGDARTPQVVRRQRNRQPALDQSAGRGPAFSRA